MNTRFCLKNRLYACLKKCAYNVLCLPFIINANAPANAQSVLKRLTDSIEYRADWTYNISDASERTPFWLSSNRYGLGGVRHSNGHMRWGVFKDEKKDSNATWRMGYGADFVLAHNYTSDFFVQQLYMDLGYKNIIISAGAKERPANLKNNELSTGSQTFGINARPVPEIRFEVPDYITLFGGKKLFSIRAHIGYGMLTDGAWEETFANKSRSHYAKNVLYHSKSGFLKIGNENIFPLTFEGGLEMAGTFGGRYYSGDGYSRNLYQGIGDFADILFGLSSDPGEGDYKNTKGNTVGSWLLSINYHGKGWKARAYYDHYFEDHSGLFYKYMDYDGLYGLELNIPNNSVVNNVVYEYVYTKYQSGSIYHDETSTITDKIGGQDNYYNHNLYAGWQHWGMAMGNPLFLSPLYNNDKKLAFESNRFVAHHVGISGNPTQSLHYRMLFTFSKQFGTYLQPLEDIKYQRSFLAELTYSPERMFRRNMRGWSVGAAFAFDRGSYIGKNTGFQITLRRNGFFSL